MGARKSSRSGGSKYRSRERSPEQTEKRRTGGNDWDNIFKKGFSIFKAKEGKNTIRIISPVLIIPDANNPKKDKVLGWADAYHWGMDIHVHQSVGDPGYTSYLCLKEMLGKPCPICEDRDRAIQEDDGSEESEDHIKSLKPSRRVLVYLIDRKNDDPEVLVWSMPQYQMDQAIAKVAFDEDDNADIPIDSPDEGYNIHFEFGKDKKSGMFGYTGVKLAKNKSEVEDEFLDFIAENPLPDVLQFYSYSRIKEVHMGASTSSKVEDSEEDSNEGESQEEAEATTSLTTSLTYEKVQELDEDDLFEILETESEIDEGELEEMNTGELKEAVCELYGLESVKKEEVARSKAKGMRRKRARA